MRITKEMRESIIARCVKATFAKRTEKYEASRVKLADALYQREHGSAEKIAAKLPKEWHHTIGSICIDHDGYHYRSTYRKPPPNTVNHELKLSKLRLAPHSSSLHIKVPKGDPLHKQADDISREGCAIEKESQDLRDKLTRLLESVTTDKKLLEVWPDGKKFFPDFTPVARSTEIIPVSLVKQVNAIVQANA